MDEVIQEEDRSFLFTSESVTEGHPDKLCDQIADAILDALLKREAELEHEGYVAPNGSPADLSKVRSAIEVLAARDTVIISGEVRTEAYLDIPSIAREVILDIGYSHPEAGFDGRTCGIINLVNEQSPDIALGVDSSYEQQHGLDKEDVYEATGAGDQGLVFGYACDETPTFMPLPIFLAHRLSERLTYVRKSGKLPFLRPDGKTQVSVRYENDAPVCVEAVVVSTQHDEYISEETLHRAVLEDVIYPVFEEQGIRLSDDAAIHINPTGRFVIGGPQGDTGVTGRKIIVDTYGGMGRHGGGAFSGKDATKVDRTGSYAARWIAKNIVAAKLATRAEVQIAYAIGMAHPVSVYINTFGTAKVSEEVLANAVNQVFDLRPAALIDVLDLRRPIFRKTTNYGHFGRELPEFTWEKTNRIEQLWIACGMRDTLN